MCNASRDAGYGQWMKVNVRRQSRALSRWKDGSAEGTEHGMYSARSLTDSRLDIDPTHVTYARDHISHER